MNCINNWITKESSLGEVIHDLKIVYQFLKISKLRPEFNSFPFESIVYGTTFHCNHRCLCSWGSKLPLQCHVCFNRSHVFYKFCPVSILCSSSHLLPPASISQDFHSIILPLPCFSLLMICFGWFTEVFSLPIVTNVFVARLSVYLENQALVCLQLCPFISLSMRWIDQSSGRCWKLGILFHNLTLV